MPSLQETIHKLEIGRGSRHLKTGLIVLAVVAFTVLYNWRAYRNLAAPEAMDAAQLARNLAEGKGYTTLFIRPFSMHLVRTVNERRSGVPALGTLPDYARIKEAHPDLANPPVYPVLLAGLLKVLPFDYTITTTKPFWSSDGRFARYPPDFLIGVFNQLLFFGLVGLVYRLARRLFDPAVAWVSALILLGTELYWRFNVSGLSTTLLILIFVGLLWLLLLLDGETHAPRWGRFGLPVLAALSGGLVGVGCLTRYAFGWLLIPVLLFVTLFSGLRRVKLCLIALAAFLLVVGPWLARNYSIGGTLFGTAGYAVVENTAFFPEHRLQRSLQPDFAQVSLRPLWSKLFVNTRSLVQTDLLKLGGGWMAGFFLAGLLVSFRNPTVRRLRYFLLFCLPVLLVVQALGRTQLSDDSPEINSENLLVLLGPLVIVLGVSFFFLLLDQIKLPFPRLRTGVIGLFAALMCLPMICAFLAPRTNPVVYPPYFPPIIQEAAGYMKENELMMSDIPWAVAWYGNRQSIWMTLDAQEEFFAVNDYLKPVGALYLAREPLGGSKSLAQWFWPGGTNQVVVHAMIQMMVPPSFPLRASHARYLPEQVFLADWARWRKSD